MWNWFRWFIRFGLTTRRRRTAGLRPEQLEHRVVLSANVTAIVRGGSLIVTGDDPVAESDDAGAEVYVRQTAPGMFFVKCHGTLNGTSDNEVLFSGVTRDLRFSFGSGNDSLTFNQTSTITVSGSIRIDGGGGYNTVSHEFHNDALNAAAAAGSLKVGGSLSILSAGGQFVSLSNLSVRGNVSIRNLTNSAEMFTKVRIDGSERTRLSQIEGDLLIANGPGQNGHGDEIVLDSVAVKGSITIRNQAKNAFVELGSSTATTTVGGNLQIMNGPGELYQTTLKSVEVKKDVHIKNQGLSVITEIGSFDGQTSIGGNLNITNGLGKSSSTETPAADTTIQRTGVGKNLDISTTHVGGQNILLLSSTISGSTNLRSGSGDDSIVLNDAVFKGRTRLEAGGGNDLVSIGKSSTVLLMKFVTEERTRTKTVYDLVTDPITGETHLVHRVVEETYMAIVPVKVAVNLAAGSVKFHRTAQMRLGEGDDTLTLANDTVVSSQTGAVLNGQKGSNTVSVGIGKALGKFRFKHFVAAGGFR